MKILVVDDTELIRVMVEDLLLFLGHQVRSVASGKEALTLLERYIPDIVVTDRRMPGMSGEELIRHIRTSKPDLPIVLMTGDDLSDFERDVIHAVGASAIIPKPFPEVELGRILDEVIKISPA